LKITEIAQIVGLLFLQLRLWFNFDKKGLGYTLGDFQINSSGRPVISSTNTYTGSAVEAR
jgi:hypothetical protein